MGFRSVKGWRATLRIEARRCGRTSAQGLLQRSRVREQPLSALRLDLDQPQDDVGIALARPAHGGETVDDGRLESQTSRWPFSFNCGSKPNDPSGRVAQTASKASAAMAMRIMGRNLGPAPHAWYGSGVAGDPTVMACESVPRSWIGHLAAPTGETSRPGLTQPQTAFGWPHAVARLGPRRPLSCRCLQQGLPA